METRRNPVILNWLTILSIFSAAIYFSLQLVNYSNIRARLQAGTSVEGVPIGGLTQQEARDRLNQIYSRPVELYFQDAIIHIDPADISFRADLDSIFAVIETFRSDTSFWFGFWAYLWNQRPGAVDVEIVIEYDRRQLEGVLDEINAVYAIQPGQARGNAATINFEAGAPGLNIDKASSIQVIDLALRQPSNRRAHLTLAQGEVVAPTQVTIGDFVQDYISQLGFQGVLSMMIINLETGEELPLQADIAVSGMELMTVPMAITAMRTSGPTIAPDLQLALENSVQRNSVEHANAVLTQLGGGDPALGAALVTQTMQQLGLQSTFMAGFYGQDGPAPEIQTPANGRIDINTGPDAWRQTTAREITWLMANLDLCANEKGGTFRLVYPQAFTPAACQQLIDLFRLDRIGALIEAGVPPQFPIAHRHGLEISTYGDVAIVEAPSGSYALGIFVWRPEALDWNIHSTMVSDISRAVYGFYNE